MFSPRNTAKDDPTLHLIGAMDAQRRTGNPSDMILEQEVAGRRELVNSEVLPTQINGIHGYKFDIKKALTDIGFKFGEQVDGDSLFQQVELPSGWKKVATDHSMWSKVVDDKGRERLSIFYKTVFYDRDAFYNIVPAITIEVKRDDHEQGKKIVVDVKKGDEIVFSTEPVVATGDIHNVYDVEESERAKARAWVEKNYPDSANPTLYWD